RVLLSALAGISKVVLLPVRHLIGEWFAVIHPASFPGAGLQVSAFVDRPLESAVVVSPRWVLPRILTPPPLPPACHCANLQSQPLRLALRPDYSLPGDRARDRALPRLHL